MWVEWLLLFLPLKISFLFKRNFTTHYPMLIFYCLICTHTYCIFYQLPAFAYFLISTWQFKSYTTNSHNVDILCLVIIFVCASGVCLKHVCVYDCTCFVFVNVCTWRSVAHIECLLQSFSRLYFKDKYLFASLRMWYIYIFPTPLSSSTSPSTLPTAL